MMTYTEADLKSNGDKASPCLRRAAACVRYTACVANYVEYCFADAQIYFWIRSVLIHTQRMNICNLVARSDLTAPACVRVAASLSNI